MSQFFKACGRFRSMVRAERNSNKEVVVGFCLSEWAEVSDMACGIACLTHTHVRGSFNRDSPSLASLPEAPLCYTRGTEREEQREREGTVPSRHCV
jgi:hypothetical protein